MFISSALNIPFALCIFFITEMVGWLTTFIPPQITYFRSSDIALRCAFVLTPIRYNSIDIFFLWPFLSESKISNYTRTVNKMLKNTNDGDNTFFFWNSTSFCHRHFSFVILFCFFFFSMGKTYKKKRRNIWNICKTISYDFQVEFHLLCGCKVK